jgi:hypothetical protein
MTVAIVHEIEKLSRLVSTKHALLVERLNQLESNQEGLASVSSILLLTVASVAPLEFSNTPSYFSPTYVLPTVSNAP